MLAPGINFKYDASISEFAPDLGNDRNVRESAFNRKRMWSASMVL